MHLHNSGGGKFKCVAVLLRTERFETNALSNERRDVGSLHAVPSAEPLQVIPPQVLVHPEPVS